LAIFNRGDSPAEVKSPFAHFGLPGKAYKSRELWTKAELGKSESVSATIPPHGVAVFALTK
jgi:alpha-galactosidase